MALMIIFGLFQIVTGQVNLNAPAAIGTSFSGLGFILFMRAFSSGSSSLTGVEAISNAVPNFKEPKSKKAASTLAIMAIILAFFFAGVTYLSYFHGIVPGGSDTVLSKIAATIFGGRNLFYYILQLATAAILAVAANTGFSAFPMLAFNLAKDRYLPHLYMDRGDRLGYSNGIISLAIGAIILILIFHGSTDNLIPLYALGVFVPFTLSQSGMIVHWLSLKDRGWQFKSMINFVGAAISAVLVVTIFLLRFKQIWPYLIIMPVIIYLFLRVKNHYKQVARQLRVTTSKAKVPTQFKGSTVLVLVSHATVVTQRAVSYATSIGDQVIAMHVSFDADQKKERQDEKEFKKLFPDVRYVDIHTSYRSILKPTVDFVKAISKKTDQQRRSLTIIVPQFVPKKPWQNILHNQNALRLRQVLANRTNAFISTYYYHLDD
jgi:hypothetical protein